jgi:hypothetical protein
LMSLHEKYPRQNFGLAPRVYYFAKGYPSPPIFGQNIWNQQLSVV